MPAASVVKIEDGAEHPAAAHAPESCASDEDLIAMLAECAAKPEPSADAEHDSFAQVLSERMHVVACEIQQRNDESTGGESPAAANGRVGMEHGDEELMAALASCCRRPSPFESAEDALDATGGAGDKSSRGPDSAAAASMQEAQLVVDGIMDLDTLDGVHGMAFDERESHWVCHDLFQQGL